MPFDKKEYNRLYHLKHKEKIKERHRLYGLENKEKLNEQSRLWHLNNKDKNKEYNKTPAVVKGRRIYEWKTTGLIPREGENLDDIYQIYMETTNCKACKVLLTMHPEPRSNTTKCMDHNHETGFFRQILCHRCNLRDNWKKINI